MARPDLWRPDPKLDLVLERDIDVPVELVWAAWTQPKLIVKWFTPAPWTTVRAEMDLRPGGRSLVVMRSPEGQEFPNFGSILEVVPNTRLVWTDAMGPGFRPSDTPFMTAVLILKKKGKGTHYIAMARHANVEARVKHEGMGFHEGWGKALDQLVAVMSKKKK
jgi:uncharacterized protein YndB with AHSA1/START domain